MVIVVASNFGALLVKLGQEERVTQDVVSAQFLTQIAALIGFRSTL
jgi:hypothetical protein